MIKSEKILSFSPYAYWQLHALYEVALCHNFQARGHSYNYVSCDGLFSDCDMFWEATVGPRPANACTVCQSQVKSLLQNCAIPNQWLGKYKSEEDETAARNFAKELADSELLDAVFRTYPVGAWIKSSVHTHLRINTIDLGNAKHCATLRSYIYSGAVAIACMGPMLDALQPTIMLLFNGRMSVTRIAMELAKERGIRVVCHERGLSKETLLLWENESCLALRPYSKLWQQWGDIPLSRHEVPQVTQWLLDRSHGTNLNWKPFNVQSSLGTVEGFLEANKGKKIWSLFTSSTDEIDAEPEYSSSFVTQYQWIEETVSFARGNPGIALIIRVHPNSGGKNSTGRNLEELGFFQRLQAALPANVALVMPDDKVSSYALIDRSDLGLVYGSTVALEMACRGKKVLLAARTPWMSCGSIELLTDPAGYAELLSTHAVKITHTAEAEKIATAAYRFAYAYAYRWNIPFPLVSMPDTNNGVLTAKTIDELKPGKHDCLDYCAEIVLGFRPSIPFVTAPVKKGAHEEEFEALRIGLKTLSGKPPAAPVVRVSVIIPCYNYGRYLRDCVRSVAAQTFGDFEIIIVNDGSTDNSLAVAKACAAEFSDLEIKIIDQPNAGQPAISRNNGIAQARGEFIVALDADDWIAPSFLEECVRTLDASQTLSVAFTDTVYHHANGRVEVHPTGEFTVARLRQNNQLSCCSLFRKKVWETVGGIRTNVRGYEDWDYWLAAAAAGFTGKRIAKPLFFYRAKDTGVFSETVAQDQSRRARIKLNNPTCYSAEERAQAEALLASEPAPNSLDTLRQTASAHYQAGDWAACVAACTQALELAHDDCDVLPVYADALSKTGQIPEALAAMERLIRLEPDVEDHKQMRAGFSALLTTAAPTGLVSVVIPCYNQAEFLREAVESVLAQTYTSWEILIVNDGSPDDTSAVAQSLILQHSTRTIRLIEKANGGLADARNAGIRFARGDFILPLDADDKIHPAFLAKTMALLEKNPDVSIAYTDWLYFGAHQTLRHAIDYNFERLCTKENLFTCTSLYRKAAWTAAGGYNTNMTKGLEDWDFWISCGKRGFTGKRIPEPLFFYRAKAGSMIHTVQPHVRTMFARIVLNHSDIYNTDLTENALKSFAAANLPAPKPISRGVEWLKPEKNLADFQQAMERAETAVRQQRLDEALTHIDQALRFSPDDESTRRASEIKQLLTSTGVTNPVDSPGDSTDSAPASDEFFGADEIKTIEQLIAAYAEKPTDTSTRAPLEELQQGVMNFLVTAESEKLETLFAKSFGQVFRALLKSGLTAEPPAEKSEAQLAILDEALANPDNPAGAFDLRPLLARMLCAPAHRGTAALALEKIPAWFLDDYLGYILHAPQVFVHEGEAERYHDHMLACAREIARRTRTAPNNPLTLKIAAFFASKASYIPLYFSNRNTREVAEKRAAIMEFFLAKNGAAIDFTPPKRPKSRKKIKVGYVSAHFGAQTETHVTLPSLQLDRSKFEICLFAVAINPGPVEDYARSLADSFRLLPKNYRQQVKVIREAALDVVIIGTNVTAVSNAVALIALHRLAPLQLASYCSPVSTGMRHIDGFITGTLNNYPGLQEHFTEKLHFCEGPPGCLDYTVESPGSGKTFDRASLGLADDDVVFVNAAACFKILPEMQETWAKILAAVPKSRLLLLPFNPNWSNAFPLKQFERTLTEACARHGVGRERFILAGSLPSRADVKALERVADVYLDTSPFSGSISVIDPLELGLPLVVQEGATHRSRMASALLREIGLPELITTDETAYIALAHRLGTDATYRRQLNERILAAMALRPKFINAQAYAQGLGALLESLVRVR